MPSKYRRMAMLIPIPDSLRSPWFSSRKWAITPNRLLVKRNGGSFRETSKVSGFGTDWFQRYMWESPDSLPDGAFEFEMNGTLKGPFSLTPLWDSTTPLLKGTALVAPQHNDADWNLRWNGPSDTTTYFGRTASTLALWTFDSYTGNRIPGMDSLETQLGVRNGFPPLAISTHGNAATFDNSNKRFFVYAAFDPLMKTGKTTFEARVFVNSYPSENHGGLATIVGPMQLYENGAIAFKVLRRTVSWAAWDGGVKSIPGVVPLNTWVNVALSIDTTTQPEQVYAYINGIPVQMVGTPMTGPILLGESEFDIGGDPSDHQPLHGRIEEVRISTSLIHGAGLPLVPASP
jgi:hypothetical protein